MTFPVKQQRLVDFETDKSKWPPINRKKKEEEEAAAGTDGSHVAPVNADGVDYATAAEATG